jgi:hypothetical protein
MEHRENDKYNSDEMSLCKLPVKVRGRWIRFTEEMRYDLPNCNEITGGKGTGKSALCEALATQYAEKDPDSKILDFWGSRDCEGVAWCRSPYKDKVLLLVGDSVKIRSRFPSVKVSDFKLESMKHYKVCVTVSAFYSSDRERHHGIQTIMSVLWGREGWNHIWTLILREMANLIYSRLSIGEDQAQAKAYLINALREMRHSGYALCADSIKFKSVDSDVRSLADYQFIKACGKEGLPDDLKYLYAYFKPFSIMRMPVDQFMVISKKGTIGRGYFEFPRWHKRENEHIFDLLGIHIEHEDEPDLNTRGGRINDSEHIEIIRKRLAGDNGKPLSFTRLATRTARSSSSVYQTVKYHNEEVERVGYCDKCKRLSGPFQSVKV